MEGSDEDVGHLVAIEVDPARHRGSKVVLALESPESLRVLARVRCHLALEPPARFVIAPKQILDSIAVEVRRNTNNRCMPCAIVDREELSRIPLCIRHEAHDLGTFLSVAHV